MGRGWPPRREDLEEAESVCRELGLGPLLQKMPSGLFQMVGESGWQLSHGELSRLFIARALLQNADLVVLDESLGAMDPESQRRGLACVTRRANSLLLIAQMYAGRIPIHKHLRSHRVVLSPAARPPALT